MMYNEQPKPVQQSLEFYPSHPVQQSLEFLPLDFSQNLYGAHDTGMVQQQQQQQHSATPTPSQASYMTDTSFMTDDNVPGLLMSACSHEGGDTANFQ